VVAKTGSPPRREPRGKRKLFPWLLMTPSVLLVLLVTLAPIAQAILYSFYDTTFLQRTDYIGLENYRQFFSDPLARTNIVNTLVFTFASLAVTMPLAMGLAVLLNRDFRGRALFRTVLIMPWIISQLATALLWLWVYSPDIGPVGYVLAQLSNGHIDVLGNPDTAMLGLIVANIWRTYPYAMVLTLAALQTVPSELYDAAKVDGAHAWQRFRYVTLPMIQRTVLIAVIILSIHYITKVELPLVLTGGGPTHATEVLGLRVYQEAFQLFHFGLSSAIAMIMFIINAIVSLAYIYVLRTDSRN
jgi:multiple sugar transport system permease protein